MIGVAQLIRFNPRTAIKKLQLLQFYLIYNNNYEYYLGIFMQKPKREYKENTRRRKSGHTSFQ